MFAVVLVCNDIIKFFEIIICPNFSILLLLIRGVSRVTTDLESLEKSGNLKETSERNLPKKSGNLRQNYKSHGKVEEFCCLKFIFSQVEDPNFETFLGEHVPRPPKWSRTHGRA